MIINVINVFSNTVDKWEFYSVLPWVFFLLLFNRVLLWNSKTYCRWRNFPWIIQFLFRVNCSFCMFNGSKKRKKRVMFQLIIYSWDSSVLLCGCVGVFYVQPLFWIFILGHRNALIMPIKREREGERRGGMGERDKWGGERVSSWERFALPHQVPSNPPWRKSKEESTSGCLCCFRSHTDNITPRLERWFFCCTWLPFILWASSSEHPPPLTVSISHLYAPFHAV